MTISVGELFDECGLRRAGVVQWDEQIELDVPGVYIVSSTPDLGDPAGRTGTYGPNFKAFDALRSRCPLVTVDGVPATSGKLAERIGAFWIPESAVLYIGLAGTSVRKRVNQYYSTPIGHRSPHAGGWWLKTLQNLEALYVHYAAAESPKLAESRLLKSFAAAVPTSVRATLHDTERIAPFANVQVHSGARKKHGMADYKLKGATASTISKPSANTEQVLAKHAGGVLRNLVDALDTRKGTRVQSQVITDMDRTGSNLRLPARSKFAFPAIDGYLDVSWQGQTVQARWRVNGSRSGTLGLGRTIMSSIGTQNGNVWLWVGGTSIVIED